MIVKDAVSSYYQRKAVELEQISRCDTSISPTTIQMVQQMAWDVLAGDAEATQRVSNLPRLASVEIVSSRTLSTQAGDPWVKMQTKDGKTLGFFPRGKYGPFVKELNQ